MRFFVPPWAHQLEAIEQATNQKDGYALFHETGTGKTATTINILRRKFMQAGRVMRTLILCPPVVKQNWRREIKLHASEKVYKRTLVLEGSGKQRVSKFTKFAFYGEDFHPTHSPASYKPENRIFITNYESLSMKGLWPLLKKWSPEILVYDESHLLKNHKSKRSLLATELADHGEFKILLTGTPILNTPMDIWSQFRILDKGRTFDNNFYAFRARYFVDKNAGMPKQKYFPDWRPIKNLDKVFNQKIYKKASRVLKQDCLDLPPLVRKRLDCELSADQKKMYNDMKKNLIAYLDDKACVASIALVKGMRMQQIVSGFFVDDNEQVHYFKENKRLEVLKELLEQITPGHKVIVWTCFRANYQQIEAMIETTKSLKDVKVCRLYGGMGDKARQKSVDDFERDPEARIMIANQAAGGTGVNMIEASYSIYYSRTFSLEHDLQSEARNYRGGSQIHKCVTRIDLVTPDTIDEVVLDALSRKENLANKILEIRDKL